MHQCGLLLLLLFVYQITSEDYPTCTVPETTVVNQIRDRLLALEERFNANVSEQVVNLEKQLTASNADIQRLTEEKNALQTTVESMQTVVTSLIKNQTAILEREQLLQDPDWFTPFNGFQYRVTSSRQDWRDSATICQSLGGQLAFAGVKNNQVRLRIAKSLNIENTWIGLSDIVKEGDWLWSDGTSATAENTDWFRGEPSNNRGDQHCGEIWGKDFSYRLNDDFCDKDQHALCERRLAV